MSLNCHLIKLTNQLNSMAGEKIAQSIIKILSDEYVKNPDIDFMLLMKQINKMIKSINEQYTP